MRQSSVRGDGPRARVRQRGNAVGPGRVGPPREAGGPERGQGQDKGQGDGGRPRGHRRAGARPRRRRHRILRWFSITLAVLTVGTAGAGYLWYQHLNSNIKTDKLNIGEHHAAKPTPNAAGQTPLNILLIGSDARDSKANQKLGGAKDTFGGVPLADVQMLVHLSADRSNMSVVSMPRDTLLKLPKCTDPKTGTEYPATVGRQMTNESLGRGGPGCTVATWELLTGIHIDHFMMVDFAGVVSMADAIGGVPVCVDANIYSKDRLGHGSGLKLAKGTHPVKGKQALQWLRTRYGFEDGSDIARTKAQHMYMNSMVRQMRENATITNPGKLRSLAEEATRALHVDEGLDTVKKLYDLSNELKKPAPKRITMTTMPFVYVGARVAPKPGDADKLFRLVREDVALDGKDKKKAPPKESDDPAAADGEIAVQVQNGTRTAELPAASGRAGTVAQILTAKGFTKASADQSQSLSEEKTVIRFPSVDLEGDAQRVAKSLGIPLDSVKKSTDVSGVTLVVGDDWREGNTYPKSSKDDDTTPDTALALNGSDTKACMKVNKNFTW